MTGGAGFDRFVFATVSESGKTSRTRDVIMDFAPGDRIDLSRIDANSTLGGDQAFALVSAFSGKAGQVQVKALSSGFLVEGDSNGDKKADFSIEVRKSGLYSTLVAEDFHM